MSRHYRGSPLLFSSSTDDAVEYGLTRLVGVLIALLFVVQVARWVGVFR